MARALIFDSGVGGLSVAAEIRKLLPGLRMTYAADDIFRPYGNKTAAALKARLPELIWVLAEMTKPDVIVIACNTASTTALGEIRAAVDAPVVGVVPAIKPAAEMSDSKTIAVLGTPGTVRRQYVDGLISDFASDCHVILQGSVNLVDMAERKLAGETVSADEVKAEIAPMFAGPKGADIDAVVLACTHFPLLKDELKASSENAIQWIDSGEAIARRVKSVLKKVDLKTLDPEEPDVALLIGPRAGAARRKAFADFGFLRVVGLMG